MGVSENFGVMVIFYILIVIIVTWPCGFFKISSCIPGSRNRSPLQRFFLTQANRTTCRFQNPACFPRQGLWSRPSPSVGTSSPISVKWATTSRTLQPFSDVSLMRRPWAALLWTFPCLKSVRSFSYPAPSYSCSCPMLVSFSSDL